MAEEVSFTGINNNIVGTIIETLGINEFPSSEGSSAPNFSNCTLSMVSGYSSWGGSSSVCLFFYKLTGQVNGQNFTVIYETSDKNYSNGFPSNSSPCKIHKVEWDNRVG